MSFSGLGSVLDGEYINLCVLFKVELASTTLFLASQNIPFTDINGQEWQAANGAVVSYEDVNFGVSANATKRTYRLSLDSVTMANGLVMQESEYRRRKTTQFLQIFDADWQPVGAPQFMHVGIMDLGAATIDEVTGRAEFALDCEGLFVRKDRSSRGILNETNHKQDFPDDEFLDRQKELQKGVSLDWPPV